MNLDYEFDYVMSLKKFVNDTKKKLTEDEYTILEYKLEDPIKEDLSIDDIDDIDSDKPILMFNPDYDNTKIINIFKENKLMGNPVIDNSEVEHWKGLANYSYNALQRIHKLF